MPKTTSSAPVQQALERPLDEPITRPSDVAEPSAPTNPPSTAIEPETEEPNHLCACAAGCLNEVEATGMYCDFCGPPPPGCDHPCECHPEGAGVYCGQDIEISLPTHLELREAYEAACRTVCDADASRATRLRIVRCLLERLGRGRPTEATFRAVTAVIDQDARPQAYKTDKDCYTAHSASCSSFRQWRAKLVECGLIRRGARSLPAHRHWSPHIPTSGFDSSEEGDQPRPANPLISPVLPTIEHLKHFLGANQGRVYP